MTYLPIILMFADPEKAIARLLGWSSAYRGKRLFKREQDSDCR